MSMKRVQQGFTLIELMIVVAIIGILAAVAIPQYKNYTIKAKLGNAMSAVDTIKSAIALCAQEKGIAAGAAVAGCDSATDGSGVPAFAATKEVSAVTVSATTGEITATLDTSVTGAANKVCWVPTVQDTSLVWNAGTDLTDTALVAAVTKNNKAATAPTCS